MVKKRRTLFGNVKRGYGSIKKTYNRLGKDYTRYQNAPKLGERRITKIKKSKGFKRFTSRANRISNNIDNYFQG